MSLLFPELNRARTLQNVSDFFEYDLDRLVLMSGKNLTDLKSPQISKAPIHSTGSNSREDTMIRGLDAGAMVDAVKDTILHCSYDSRVILIELFINHKTWFEVENILFCNHKRLGFLRKKAMFEFADGFDYWQRRHNCEPIIDLHAYKRNFGDTK
ncbi:ArpU family phage transcriptional regulator [Lactobacillus colini]|uniref:ArpU family phage transcriptional regulator n=1 Tax=Lactobacillus colini TaxID=1819254 RepID=A0ABS4MBG3_9LACO|nr:ArpU family phage packaging/lysis transcriptional regulator [Lactobacillus colini]MBP2056996.1 ArpU family phage transcriptional regulator [Lactobacillus colini]